MKESPELLALRREVLVARSSLCRLKVRRDAEHLRGSMSLPGLGAGLASSAPVREVMLGLLLSRLGTGRVSRVVALASGALAVAKLVVAAMGLARTPPAPPPPSSPAP